MARAHELERGPPVNPRGLASAAGCLRVALVDGLRIALIGGPPERYLRDLLPVGAIAVGALAAGVGATAWRRRWRIRS